jgi:hypothetical protein
VHGLTEVEGEHEVLADNEASNGAETVGTSERGAAEGGCEGDRLAAVFAAMFDEQEIEVASYVPSTR